MTKLKGRGQLGDPTGITVLPNGNVLVSDSQKGCIHVYDSTSGKYQGKLDIMEMHQPDSPSGIVLVLLSYHAVYSYIGLAVRLHVFFQLLQIFCTVNFVDHLH